MKEYDYDIYVNDIVVHSVTATEFPVIKIIVRPHTYKKEGEIFLYDLDIGVRLYQILQNYLNPDPFRSFPVSKILDINISDLRKAKGFGKVMEKEFNVLIEELKQRR